MEWGGPSARADVVLNQGVRKGLGLVTFVQRPEDREEGEPDSCHKSLFSTLGNFDATSAGLVPSPEPLSLTHWSHGPACWEVSSLRQGRPLALSVRALLDCLGRMDRDHPGGPWLLPVHSCLHDSFCWSQPRFSSFLVPAQQTPPPPMHFPRDRYRTQRNHSSLPHLISSVSISQSASSLSNCHLSRIPKPGGIP